MKLPKIPKAHENEMCHLNGRNTKGSTEGAISIKVFFSPLSWHLIDQFAGLTFAAT